MLPAGAAPLPRELYTPGFSNPTDRRAAPQRVPEIGPRWTILSEFPANQQPRAAG